jgi:LytS/YehU family sensor histidine kinase
MGSIRLQCLVRTQKKDTIVPVVIPILIYRGADVTDWILAEDMTLDSMAVSDTAIPMMMFSSVGAARYGSIASRLDHPPSALTMRGEMPCRRELNRPYRQLSNI